MRFGRHSLGVLRNIPIGNKQPRSTRLVSRPSGRPALTDLRLRSRRRALSPVLYPGRPAARRPTPTSSPPGSGPCLTPRLGPSGTSSFSENLSLKTLSSALQRARPEPSAENRQPSRFAAIRPSSPERIFFDDLIFNPSRSASDAPIRPVPPGTRSARSAAPSARHPRPTVPTSSVPPDARVLNVRLQNHAQNPPSTGLLRQKSPSNP